MDSCITETLNFSVLKCNCLFISDLTYHSHICLFFVPSVQYILILLLFRSLVKYHASSQVSSLHTKKWNPFAHSSVVSDFLFQCNACIRFAVQIKATHQTITTVHRSISISVPILLAARTCRGRRFRWGQQAVQGRGELSCWRRGSRTTSDLTPIAAAAAAGGGGGRRRRVWAPLVAGEWVGGKKADAPLVWVVESFTGAPPDDLAGDELRASASAAWLPATRS